MSRSRREHDGLWCLCVWLAELMMRICVILQADELERAMQDMSEQDRRESELKLVCACDSVVVVCNCAARS